MPVAPASPSAVPRPYIPSTPPPDLHLPHASWSTQAAKPHYSSTSSLHGPRRLLLRGTSDYARWREDLAAFVEPAGPDFTKALFFNGSIDQARPYTDDLVTSDTAASRPTLTMAQMQQHSLLGGAELRETS